MGCWGAGAELSEPRTIWQEVFTLLLKLSSLEALRPSRAGGVIRPVQDHHANGVAREETTLRVRNVSGHQMPRSRNLCLRESNVGQFVRGAVPTRRGWLRTNRSWNRGLP